MDSAQITTNNPTVILFLIDQSGSMKELVGNTGASKARYVADVLNRTIYQLITRNRKKALIRDRVEVAIVTYQEKRATLDHNMHFRRGNFLKLSELDAIARIEERFQKVPDASGKIVEQSTKVPVWFDPVASGDTPMVSALGVAADLLRDWCSFHKDAYPPTVIHVTDGEARDGDPSKPAEQLKSICTNDGNCLLMNMHISSNNSPAVLFPKSDHGLDKYGQLLFRLSSKFTSKLVETARVSGGYDDVDESSALFAYRAGSADIVRFFELGSTHLE